jgi:hypothetical protein
MFGFGFCQHIADIKFGIYTGAISGRAIPVNGSGKKPYPLLNGE